MMLAFVARYRFDDFVVSPRRRVLLRGGQEVPIIPRYFDLLVFLVEHRDRAVHRRDIFERIWRDVVVSDSALTQAIRTIRRTLGDDSRESRFIRTVSRHGYQFVHPGVVEEDEEGEAAFADAVPAAEPSLAGAPAGPVTATITLPGTPVPRWVAGSAGGAAAGLFAGVAGGLLLVGLPDSPLRLATVPVLALVGVGCGAIGGAGVAGGLALADRFRPGALTAVAGAALGGAIVGGAGQWLGTWALETLVGIAGGIGGGIEGLVIGAAAGIGYVLASPPDGDDGVPPPLQTRIRLASLMALCCGVAALAITVAGRPLVGGTLHAIARGAEGAQLTLTPLGLLLGEPDFGPVSRAVIGGWEGTLFGFGLGFGLFSPTSLRSSPRPSVT